VGAATTSIYNATKFGLDGFSQALRREVLSQGIHVCVIYPGPTTGTEFGTHTRPDSGRLRVGWIPWMRTDTDSVAAAIVGLADRPRARIVIPPLFGLVIMLNNLLPALGDLIVARVARRARLRLRA
jgi:short-subunit dehydrogenase